jgi:hypothetical protein
MQSSQAIPGIVVKSSLEIKTTQRHALEQQRVHPGQRQRELSPDSMDGFANSLNILNKLKHKLRTLDL